MGLHELQSLKPCKHGCLPWANMLKTNRIQRFNLCKQLFTIEFQWVEKANLANIIRI